IPAVCPTRIRAQQGRSAAHPDPSPEKAPCRGLPILPESPGGWWEQARRHRVTVGPHHVRAQSRPMATVPNPTGADTALPSMSDNRRGSPMSFDPSHDLASGDARAALERRARTETVYSPIVILLTALAAV